MQTIMMSPVRYLFVILMVLLAWASKGRADEGREIVIKYGKAGESRIAKPNKWNRVVWYQRMQEIKIAPKGQLVARYK